MINNRIFFIDHKTNKIYNEDKTKELLCRNKKEGFLIYKNDFFKIIRFDSTFVLFYHGEVLISINNLNNIQFSEDKIVFKSNEYFKEKKEYFYQCYSLTKTSNELCITKDGIFDEYKNKIKEYQINKLFKYSNFLNFGINSKNEIIPLFEVSDRPELFRCEEYIYFENYKIKSNNRIFSFKDFLNLSNYDFDKTKKYSFAYNGKDLIYFENRKIIKHWEIEEEELWLNNYIIGDIENDFILLSSNYRKSKIINLNKNENRLIDKKHFNKITEEISQLKLIIKTPNELYETIKKYELIDKFGGLE